VAPPYFETLGVSILRGRPLDERDVEGAAPVAVVSHSLAERLFPGRDPLGERVRVGSQELPPYTVVGVAEDVKHASLVDGSSQGVYVTSHQWHWADRVRWIVVKADGDATRLIPSIRRAVWSAGEDQAVVRAQSMDAVVMHSEARRRFVLLLLSAFALSALVVCVVGLFGVLSGAVVERTREMGVRAALGASRQGIVSMVVRQGLVLTAVGVAMGLAGAAAARGAVGSMLFQVSPLDPLTYLGVVGVLVMGALVASVAPAVRAGRADPLESLRAE
jgi:ABC-type antimicrobial peptide transport system permease subunit